MVFYIGSDHAGYEMKETVKKYLIENDYEVVDLGTGSPDSVDYPDIAHRVAKSIQSDEDGRGVLICGTGIGMSMASNKHRGIRAALVRDEEAAKMCRAHNDANILVLAGRQTTMDDAVRFLDIFIDTPFDGGRHKRRVEKIDDVS